METDPYSREEALDHLLDWRSGHTHIMARFFELLSEADSFHFMQLAKAFPTHASVYLAWKESGMEIFK